MNDRELRNRFQHHPPVGDQQGRYEAIREQCLQLARVIAHLTPESREQSIALTAVDDAMMHANAAIARHEQWEMRDQLVRVDQEAVNEVGHTAFDKAEPGRLDMSRVNARQGQIEREKAETDRAMRSGASVGHGNGSLAGGTRLDG